MIGKTESTRCPECGHEAHDGMCCELLIGHGYNRDTVCNCTGAQLVREIGPQYQLSEGDLR